MAVCLCFTGVYLCYSVPWEEVFGWPLHTKVVPQHWAHRADQPWLLCSFSGPHNVFDERINDMQLASKSAFCRRGCGGGGAIVLVVKFKPWRPKWRKIRNDTDNLWTWIFNLYSITTLDCRAIFNELDTEKIRFINLSYKCIIIEPNRPLYLQLSSMLIRLWVARL